MEEAMDMSLVTLTGVEPHDVEFLVRMAKNYEQSWEYEWALMMYKAALDISEEIYGQRSVSSADLLIKMGSVYEALEKHQVADVTYLLALDILTEAYGEDHPHVLLAKGRLSALRERMEE